MSNDYKVHKIWIKEAEFEALILEVPESELEDKLAYLARDKGSISKGFYEDFVIATCVANINQLLYKIKQQTLETSILMKIRSEVMDAVLKVNTLLSPDNLIINRNSVIKLKGDGDLKDDERLLSDNKSWDTAYYDDVVDSTDGCNISQDKDNQCSNKTNIMNIDDIEFEVVKQWWKRINKYVDIKKFNENAMASIFSRRFFHNRSSFQTYVVSVCVVDSEDLFIMLDNMGLPSRVAPPILMHEVYELCKEVNPFLIYENAQNLTEGNDEDENPQTNRRQAPNRMASHSCQNKKKKKNKKTFKDVPREDLLKLAETMKVFVIGQDKAVDQIVESVQRASVGLKDPAKPIGSFLFAGRTGCGKCVEKGTIIFSEQGIKPIDSFCDNKKIAELYVDVFGIDGVNKTSHIYKEGIKPGRRITTNNGYELGGSMIHPVIVIDESGNVVFKEVSDLTTDDYVAIQYDQNYFSNTNKEIHFDFTKKTHDNHSIEYKSPKEINEDLSYYLGLLLGDGCLTTDRTITFTNADKQLVKRFFDLSASIFGIVPKYNTDKYGYYYSSRFIYDFINNGCGVKMVKSTDKEIPSIILESTKECVKKFIIGLMDTDGYFEKGSGAIGITLSSKKLINQLQTVLLNFGVVSSVRHRLVKYNGGFNDAWVLKINGSYVKRYFKEIGFSLNNKKNMENTVLYKTNNTNIDTIPNIHNSLYELVSTYKLDRSFHSNYRGYYKGYRKPSRKKLTEILNVLYEKVGSKIKDNTIYVNLLSLAKENIFWSKIAKIDYVSEMDLYDFTVPVTHTFTSNGFISHNTLTTKVLADELIKDRNNLVTIDCSEYSADHEYAKLIGAPSGYIGHEQGGYLTNAVNENPFSIVVFDEIEKASSKVHELMLQILEEGRLTDGKGQKVSFKDTIVIMTSNIGVSEIEDVRKTIGFGDVSKLTEDKKTKAIDGAIKKKFKPEFLNRIDSVVHFCSLNKNDYMRIIEIELYKLNENLRNNDTDFKDLRVDFDKKVKSFIYKHGIDEEFGARPLKRCIEKEISTPLATRLLRGDIPCNSDIMITIKRGKPDFEIIEKETTDLLENRSLFKSV